MLTEPSMKATEALQELNADGYVVIENLLAKPTVAFLRDRVEAILASERDHPVDDGESACAGVRTIVLHVARDGHRS